MLVCSFGKITTSISSCKLSRNTFSFALHWFCYVYLRLAQESTISKPLEITSIVSLPAFDQGFVIYLSSCTVPLQTQRDDLHLIVFWAPPATKKKQKHRTTTDFIQASAFLAPMYLNCSLILRLS